MTRRPSKRDLPRRDDLPALKVSGLRASGAINPLMNEAVIEIGGHKAKVGLWHMFFWNDGSWSYFICPSCSRRCQTLRLYDGRFVCGRCDGLLLRCETGDREPRIERLRARLAQPTKHRPKETEWALRRARLLERQARLKGWPPKGPDKTT